MATDKAHCNTCGGERNHEILFENTSEWEDHAEHYSVSGWNKYQLLRCLGCDDVRLRHLAFNDSDGETDVSYYPPPYARPEPKWLANLRYAWGDEQKMLVGNFLKEIYVSMHNGSRRLSAIGVRSLLEHVMIQKVTDQGTFAKNIAAFAHAGFLSNSHAEYLTATIDAGHASAHRAWEPTREQLDTLMDVTENLIETVYVLKEKVDKLKPEVPARPAKS